MTVTEEQAKTKWCPMVRHGDYREEARNRTPACTNPTNSRCIGSDCMMWLWEVKRAATTFQCGSPSMPPNATIGEELPREAWQGSCGLVKP